MNTLRLIGKEKSIMKIYIDVLILIMSLVFIIDCIFTGVIHEALTPVSETVTNVLAIVLAFNSAWNVLNDFT